MKFDSDLAKFDANMSFDPSLNVVYISELCFFKVSHSLYDQIEVLVWVLITLRISLL
jgi:hypothetical protein